MLKSKLSQLFCVIILITGWLFYFYHDLILSPNDYLTADWGDGVKAYAVFIGHIKNDSTYTNYQNMNYPYGQTHIFTDGQTGIANTLKFLSNYSSFFLDNAIGLYNLMMIFSFVGCAVFLFLIIRRLNMPPLFNILGSICITVLSPQIFRMMGHLTLSYVVFFPLSWWLLIKFTESSKKILFSSLIILNSIFWFFVHPYYVMIISIFYGFWWIISLLQNKNFRTKANFLFSFLHVAVPLIITRLYVLIVDIHAFRSESPIGFWESYARWNTIFIPVLPPFLNFFKFFLPHQGQEFWEGWAYIGLPAVIVTLFSLFKIIRYLFRKNYRLILKPVLPDFLKAAVWASVFVLLFSMCLPFRLNMQFLVDWFPFLKQFRSLGRFAWVFYYVFTVYSLYVLYLAYRYCSSRNKIIALCFPLIFFSVYLAEAYHYHAPVSKAVLQGKNYFNLKFLPDDYREVIDKVNQIRSNYQCIVPLPFYHIGSENFSKPISDEMLRSSLVISYWTNLPLLANSAARSPMLEAKNIFQFFSPPYIHKEIEKDLPNKKSFLVFLNKEELNLREEEWKNKSLKIFENKSFELHELSYDDLFKNNSNELINDFRKIKPSLFPCNGFLCSSKTDTIIYKNYDDRESKITYRGKGALRGVKKEYTILLPETNYKLLSNKDYILSFWYYNKDELRLQLSGIFKETDAENSEEIQRISFSPDRSMVIDGDWSLVEIKFRLKTNDSRITVILGGNDDSDQEIFMDELLIRAADIDFYQTDKNGNMIAKNAIPVKNH